MNTRLYETLNKFFHDLTLNELRLMNQSMTSKTVTYNTLLYYDLIATHQGEYTASAIADLLHVSKPAVITKINEMIQQGYLYKVQSHEDKRIYHLFAHTEGIRDEMRYKKMDDGILEILESHYSEAELEKFCDMIGFVGKLYKEKGEHFAK